MKRLYLLCISILLIATSFQTAIAQSYPDYGVIYNSTSPASRTLALGVNPQGHLNAGIGITANGGTWKNPRTLVSGSGALGIAYNYYGVWYDATSPGCLCEGWGASAIDSYGVASVGSADVSTGGVTNVTVKSFIVDTTSIVSTVWINDSKGQPMLEVTHRYGPSVEAPSSLFQAQVTITNISGRTLKDLRYKRVMDWDIPSPEFSELVDHVGVSASVGSTRTPKVLSAGDNGFDSPSSLSMPTQKYTGGGSTVNTDFVGSGPADHGSDFIFQFSSDNIPAGQFTCGDSVTFMIYYGATPSKTDTVAALGSVGATVYSLGYKSSGGKAVFGFGFKGVSGTSLAPTLPTKIAALPSGLYTDVNSNQTYAPPVLSGSYIFQETFQYRQNKQWAGDIKRYTLDANGNFTGATPLSAASNLLKRAALDSISSSTGYIGGGRSIWTVGYDSRCMDSGVNNDIYNNSFNMSNITQLTQLLYNCTDPGGSFASDLIAFVRGKDSYWEGTSTTSSPRPSILADTFHSELVFVGPPNAPYSSDVSQFGKSESYYRYANNYQAFISSNATRRNQYYVGANDGMLHAFDDDLNERWAFVPPSVLSQLRNMMGTKGTSAGTGTSNSVFNVDGPIAVKDIYIASQNKWMTVLMGGLGWGGNSYYALDITNPDVPKHLFTINNDTTNKAIDYWDASGNRTNIPYTSLAAANANINFSTLGGTWSRPTIMLLPYASGSQTQKWVAVFGAGYADGASTTGTGSTSSYGSYVYVLDLEPNAMSSPASTGGQILTTITVPSDPSASNDIPNGVTAHLTVITSDGTSLANYYGGIAYFTDLQGQFWKLNLSKTSLGDLNSVMFGLVNSFRAQSSLSNDRLGFNQLASTVVSSSGSYQVIHYFGTGDQTRIQRRASSINNRIYGVSDPDFPAVGLANQNQTVSSSSFMSINSSSCTFGKSWWGDVSLKAKFGTKGYEKVIGRATVYNGNILFTVYQPDVSAGCPLSGYSNIVEMTSNCGSTALSGTKLGYGLATAPVVDAKGNVYVGVGNLTASYGGLPTGQGNIAKFTSSGAQSSTKVNYRSWREIRN